MLGLALGVGQCANPNGSIGPVLAGEITMQSALSGPLAGVVYPLDNSLLFAPEAAQFYPGETITVTVQSALALSGAMLAAPYSWQFSIAGNSAENPTAPPDDTSTPPTPDTPLTPSNPLNPFSPNTPTLTILVDGQPISAVSGERVDFWPTFAGEPSVMAFQLTNQGAEPLSLSDMSLPAGFTLQSDVQTIPAHSALLLNVALIAPTPGDYKGIFSFATSDAMLPRVSYTLAGSVLAVSDRMATLLVYPDVFPENAPADSVAGAVWRMEGNEAVEVHLSAQPAGRVQVPETVWIDTAQDFVEFPILLLDNTQLEGQQDITIIASAEGYQINNYTVRILDDEDPAMVAENPLAVVLFYTQIEEGQGADEWGGMVQRLAASGPALRVQLQSSDPGELLVPAAVELPADEIVAFFSLTPVDDQQLDGAQTVIITAQIEGVATPVEARILVTDKGLDTQAVAAWTEADLAKLDKSTFLHAEESSRVEFLTSLNAQTITAEELIGLGLLAEGWQISATGELLLPPGTDFSLRELQVAQTDIDYELALFDLSFALTLGGLADQPGEMSLLQELDAALAAVDYEEFELRQQHDGVLSVEGAGALAGAQFAFFPDPAHAQQAAQTAQVGVRTDANGQFLITTPNARQLGLIPAPKGIQELQAAASVEFAGKPLIKIGKRGDILFTPPTGSRRAGRVHQVVVADPQITPVADQPPGWHMQNWPDGNTRLTVVYEDRSAQNFNPAVRSPETLQREAQKIPGVQKVTSNADGTFRVELQGGQAVLVRPTFDTHSQPKTGVAHGVGAIALEGGNRVRYTYQENDTEIITILTFSLL